MAAFIALAAIIFGGCSTNGVSQGEISPYPSNTSSLYSPVPTNGLVQSNTAGKVTIDVEWLGIDNGVLTFKVAMNTHSVDLDPYDLGELAILRDDIANEYYPNSWDSRPGGHHRRGTLTFSVPNSLSQQEAKYIELIISDVAGIEDRTMTWTLR